MAKSEGHKTKHILYKEILKRSKMKIKTKYIHKGKYKQNMAKSEVGERE